MSVIDSKQTWVDGNFNVFIDEWSAMGGDYEREIKITIRHPLGEVNERTFNVYDGPAGKTPLIDLVEKHGLIGITIAGCKSSLLYDQFKTKQKLLKIEAVISALENPNDLSEYLVLTAICGDEENGLYDD